MKTISEEVKEIFEEAQKKQGARAEDINYKDEGEL